MFLIIIFTRFEHKINEFIRYFNYFWITKSQVYYNLCDMKKITTKKPDSLNQQNYAF